MSQQCRSNFMRACSGAFLKAAAAAMPLLGAMNSAEAAEKPNVLLLVSDDCRAVQHCYGEPTITPNIDRLAARGLLFEHAYCQYPLCNPSRVSFLTGRRPDNSQCYTNQANFRDSIPDTVTLPQLFKNNGYFVARIGKMYHYGVPNDIGTNGMDDPASWEKVINPRGRDCDDADKIFSIVTGEKAKVAVGKRNYGATLSWLAAEGDDSEQTDGKISREACRLLRENKEKPFFLGVGFFRPHTPYVSPKSYFDLYPADHIALAKDPADDRATKPPTALTVFPPNYGMDEVQQRVVRQAYYASVSFMDAQVGVVLKELEQLNLADKTVVVFISDHGYHLGEHGMWQKMSLYEEAARVPMIISAPGMKTAGKQTQRLAELVDLYPTLADLCNLPAPRECEGISLKPLLEDPNLPWKKGAFTQVRHGIKGEGRADKPKPGSQDQACMGRSVRSERYRYTEWGDGQHGIELYDQENDPHEWKNLAKDPASATVLAQMQKLLHDGPQAAKP
jgi:uncharacterized sulfatase